MTLEELRSLRGKMKADLAQRETEGKTTQVIVGMGTCGIASGAKDTLNAFLKEVDDKGLADHVMIRQTGCMGMCANEPTVEVIVPDMPRVIYGNVDAKVAKEIVEQHLIGKKLVDKHILDRPAADIITNK
ncbi:MAG: (2Fe-2S) ferredoxin domain-containing protein [Treponema sp.]|jgi:NADP-reducing hydrogenase subunit HndB|nr:(2Fe-2S) ferredoxin domain-containing protein [Treponema sp.]